jgi:hypothetical protein
MSLFSPGPPTTLFTLSSPTVSALLMLPDALDELPFPNTLFVVNSPVAVLTGRGICNEGADRLSLPTWIRFDSTPPASPPLRSPNWYTPLEKPPETMPRLLFPTLSTVLLPTSMTGGLLPRSSFGSSALCARAWLPLP